MRTRVFNKNLRKQVDVGQSPFLECCHQLVRRKASFSKVPFSSMGVNSQGGLEIWGCRGEDALLPLSSC